MNKGRVSSTFKDSKKRGTLAPEDFDLVVDKKTGQVWILHGPGFLNRATVERAEYNPVDHSLCFVSHDGNAQYLGATIQKPLRGFLEKAVEITAIQTDGTGTIHDTFVVRLVVKSDFGHKN